MRFLQSIASRDTVPIESILAVASQTISTLVCGHCHKKRHVIDDYFALHPDKLAKYREKILEGQVQTAFTYLLANTIVLLSNINQLLEQKSVECLLK